MARAITTKRVPCTETKPARYRVSCHELPTKFYSAHGLPSDRHVAALHKYIREECFDHWRGVQWTGGHLDTEKFVWVTATGVAPATIVPEL